MKDWRDYQNYIIIAILSLISVFILPFLGSELGLAFNIPNSPAGWIVYIVTKLIVIIINILLFDQFIKQAKVNVKNNENYKAAKKILDNTKKQLDPPRTPNQFFSKLYRKKGTRLAMTSILGVFGLTSALLTFDMTASLTYLMTIVMGIVFGWITMNAVEEYWTDEYYRLALQVEREQQEQKEQPSLSEEEYVNNIISLSEEKLNDKL